MNNFESLISNIIKQNSESNHLVFSVHNHILDREEARNSIMFHSQAISENQLYIAEHYETIYNTAFSLLYDKYSTSIFFYTIYDNLDLCEKLNFAYLKEYPNGIDTIYKSDSKEEFLKIVKLNLDEKMPFHDIVFDNCNIFIQFNFDLTIIVFYEENDIAIMNTIRKIFIESGFNLL
jgi:hypothetical protein